MLKQNEKHKRRLNSSPNRRYLTLKPRTAKLIIVLAGIGIFLSGSTLQLTSKTLALLFSNDLNAKVDLAASKITVKILGSGFLGSGFVIQQQGSTYTVITNQHVLRGGKAPYSIQTPDGKIHSAQLSELASNKYDLALLQFTSAEEYAEANIGSSSSLEVGEPTFAAGFALENSTITNNSKAIGDSKNSVLPGYIFKSGRIKVILERPLEEGYRIGYSNDVKRGMSGGPLLDRHGKVIGVNGKHAYPLWEAPDLYADGSQPCPPMQELITRSSLAIPIETGISLTPRLKSLKPDTSELAEDSNWTSIVLDSDGNDNPAELIPRMKAIAEATKNCEDLPESAQQFP
ncbi:S1 family peptidase [Myxosarcina sp. GI1(2024)]